MTDLTQLLSPFRAILVITRTKIVFLSARNGGFVKPSIFAKQNPCSSSLSHDDFIRVRCVLPCPVIGVAVVRHRSEALRIDEVPL